MTELTVVSFAWAGARPIYTPWHVANLQRQLAKHLTVPHRYVCITDQPDDPAFECETLPLWDLPPIDGTKAHWLINYVRLRLFDAWAREAVGARILCIDLDVTIRDNIDDLVKGDAPFKILKLRKRKQVQAGMFLVEPGRITPNPWDACFDPETVECSRKWVGSDQAVLSELFYDRVVGGEIPTWSERDGIVINDPEAPGWRMCFRTGERKPWDNVPEQWIYYRESGLPPLHPVDEHGFAMLAELDQWMTRFAQLPTDDMPFRRAMRRKRALTKISEAARALRKVSRA